MDELDARQDEQAAVEQVVSAWTVVGPGPDFHRMMQEKLRQEWPTLAAAVEQLVAAKR